MKIVDKQTIRIPLILSVSLIIFSTNIYLFYSNFRENEFYLYLRNNGITIEKMIVDEIFKHIYGKYCWNAQKGYGSFLTLQFGEPHLEVRERDLVRNGVKEHVRSVDVYGSWHLWIYLCDWAITAQNQIIATQSSKAKNIH